jgi:hypothetical protein
MAVGSLRQVNAVPAPVGCWISTCGRTRLTTFSRDIEVVSGFLRSRWGPTTRPRHLLVKTEFLRLKHELDNWRVVITIYDPHIGVLSPERLGTFRQHPDHASTGSEPDHAARGTSKLSSRAAQPVLELQQGTGRDCAHRGVPQSSARHGVGRL